MYTHLNNHIMGFGVRCQTSVNSFIRHPMIIYKLCFHWLNKFDPRPDPLSSGSLNYLAFQCYTHKLVSFLHIEGICKGIFCELACV